jgi:hypothetical protein
MEAVESSGTEYVINKVKYLVFVKEDVKYVKPEGGDVVKYDDFIKLEWRTFIKDKGGTRTDVPKSTASIPLKLTKVIHPKNLISIYDNGFMIKKENIALLGFSRGTQYVNRDLYIMGAWLGKSSDIGEQFLDDDEGFVTIWVEFSELFRDMFMRDSYAVLYDGDEKEKVGSTVICFAPIPAEYLYIDLPDKIVNPIKEKYSSASDLKSGYQRLRGLGKNLKLVSDELIKNAK